MGRFCFVVDGTEPDGGDLAARHQQAQALFETFTTQLRTLGMGVQFAALLTPYDGSDEEGAPTVEYQQGQPAPDVAELLAPPTTAAAPVPVPAEPSAPAAADEPAPDGTDAAAFKCPACGATAAEPTTCSGEANVYGHEPTPMQPAADVVNATEPAPDTTAPAAADSSSTTASSSDSTSQQSSTTSDAATSSEPGSTSEPTFPTS